MRARLAAALLLGLTMAVAEPSPPELRAAEPAGLDYAMFSINVQDFSYPEKSAATARKLIDIHEKHGIPVDFYLTTTMIDRYEADAPDLLKRLRTSKVASVSYHVRPPSPYYTRFDWIGLREMEPSQRIETIRRYETHGLDLTSGRPTDRPGGYQKLKELVGYAPWVVSTQADQGLAQPADLVYRDLGARFFVVHGRVVNAGEKRNGVDVRPEHVDLKLFEHVGEAPALVLDQALAEAPRLPRALPPYFVGIKMHDNDFFAERSAWVTVYVDGRRQPDWDTARKAPLLSEERQQAVWEHYEALVKEVAGRRESLTAVNAPMLALLLQRTDDTPSPSSPPDQQATKVYLSGTMHVETNRMSWPDPDRLVEFFHRATAAGKSEGRPTGMRWSIGADIGWLDGEPRAAEVIKATEALGVEWDVHAHQLPDRANVAAALTRLGGHPNRVASGGLVRELDNLREEIKGRDGASWQAGIVWGIALRPLHGPGADDNAVGLWRPKSMQEWSIHDPNGRLIAVGGGTRRLDTAERLAKNPGSGANGTSPPIVSATIMVSPRTFTVVGAPDGIEAIEAWASRVGALANVRWATIRETAEAWVTAGGIWSRREN